MNRRNKEEFAELINLNLPESEKWFWREWEGCGMRHEEDNPNEVFCGYIPDVINHRYKYVIEVDGFIHLKGKIKKKDELKNRVFEKKKYEVFRVEAYNYVQFGDLVDMVSSRRSAAELRVLKRQKPKTILRKCIA